MQKFIYKFIQFILDVQQTLHHKKLRKLQHSFSAGTTKRVFLGDNELILNAQAELKKAELEQKVKEIVKQNLNNPEQLLEFIKAQGTAVFRFKNADIFLSLIGEEEGFITPAKGLKAFFINLVTGIIFNKRPLFSFKSNGMFILRQGRIDIYYMVHQFHKWYSFELGLPGFDFSDQQNFKRIFKTLKQEDISNLSIQEIISLKESIARDIEAIDFVVNLSKEYETSKKLHNKLIAGKSVSL